MLEPPYENVLFAVTVPPLNDAEPEPVAWVPEPIAIDAFPATLPYPIATASAAVDVANARLESLKRNPSNGTENPLNNLNAEFNVEFRAMSFFDLSTEKADLFDFIYDYTFLCALDITVRTLWAEKMSDLLNIGGELMTLIFPLSETKEGGPPFKMSFKLLRDLLG